jgi:hypothetical protein
VQKEGTIKAGNIGQKLGINFKHGRELANMEDEGLEKLKEYKEFKARYPKIYLDIFNSLLEILLVDGTVPMTKAYNLAENQTANFFDKLGYRLILEQ